MSEITNAAAPDSAAPASLLSGKWIAKVILAVILAEAIWGLIVSLTNSLILPALARVMGGDPQSPLYLGKGDFNVPAIFSSILELCLAGIAAVVLNQWSRSAPVRVRVKTVKRAAPAAKASMPSVSSSGMPSILPESVVPSPVSAPVAPRVTPQSVPTPPPMPVAAPPIPAAAPAPKGAIPQPAAQPMVPAPPPASQKPAAPAKPEKPSKPEKPKEVYYNIVGEPINPTEDE
jgi:hypothetical protein